MLSDNDLIFEQAYQVVVPIAYVQKPNSPLNTNAGVTSVARCLFFGLTLFLHPYFVQTNNNGSCESCSLEHLLHYNVLLLDFSLTVKAAPHECVIRTSQP